MTILVRVDDRGTARLGALRDGRFASLPLDSMASALRLRLAELRTLVDAAEWDDAGDLRLLAPVDAQEVWAAGVTYRRSRDARLEESGGADVYERVYRADRPELFFKSQGWRVAGPGEPIGVRSDSSWNLPEAELTAIINAHGEVVGYTVGNDVSSRDIEGANSLYLPQAKVYRRSCALGPGVLPAWEVDPPGIFTIGLEVQRNGATVAAGSVDTRQMVRSVTELVDWLWRSLDFPDGVALMTGTGVVPGAEFSLSAGDDVTIAIDGVGELCNPVVEVGPRC